MKTDLVLVKSISNYTPLENHYLTCTLLCRLHIVTLTSGKTIQGDVFVIGIGARYHLSFYVESLFIVVVVIVGREYPFSPFSFNNTCLRFPRPNTGLVSGQIDVVEKAPGGIIVNEFMESNIPQVRSSFRKMFQHVELLDLFVNCFLFFVGG